MNVLSNIKLKIKLKLFPYNLTNDEYISFLREHNIKVGKGTQFYGPSLWTVDTQRPWLIEIGEYCKITRGVSILSHDYSRSVLRRVYGDIVAEAKKTVIGNNVFIGINSIILMGATIGNNVIIGAGSVVGNKIPDNVVVAGNPAKVIRSLDEHYVIRKKKCVKEAKICAKEFFSRYGRKPRIQDMGAFFPIYLKRSENEILRYNLNIKLGGDDRDDVLVKFLKSAPIYSDYDAFINDVDFGGE